MVASRGSGPATRGTLTAATGARRLHRGREHAIHAALFLCGAVSILTTAGIVAVLIVETVAFFREVPLLDFLTDTQWTPLFAEKHFGILPLLNATLLISAGAMVVALPLGLGSAVYLNEYARPRVRAVLKPLLEVLAGIPTVVYGYFALLFVTPILRSFVPETQIFNALSAAIVMGIMILPMVSSLSEDAMNAVPTSLREAAQALGATRVETSLRVIIPAALSGIAASFILAISRAIGETMIVTVAAGQMPRLSWNPLEGMETMTAYIVQVSLGDTPTGTLAYKTIFAVGMTLFVITLGLNFLSQWFVRRFREVYE
ncbi:MAG: phosphate ABC transporter permease subunit PstC [Gemmatimonadetes bacterium]|nr:phosphate ABC transporter permease subunit PstC [Gemmatimonadota bacterium]